MEEKMDVGLETVTMLIIHFETWSELSVHTPLPAIV